MTFQASALLPSSGKEAPNLVDFLHQTVLPYWHIIMWGSLDTTETVNLLRYAPENKSSPRIQQNGYWKLKIKYKT
jgi:hypothetical protein